MLLISVKVIIRLVLMYDKQEYMLNQLIENLFCRLEMVFKLILLCLLLGNRTEYALERAAELKIVCDYKILWIILGNYTLKFFQLFFAENFLCK